MDLEKYYTPYISEFHVGFEYEYSSGLSEWKRATIKEEDFMAEDSESNWFFDINRGYAKTRVKYLDKEDIESLGWRFDGRAVDDWFKIEGRFDMGTWTCYKMRMHYGYGNRRLFVVAEDIGNNEDVFQGVIKNKSELKSLMVQLGIK